MKQQGILDTPTDNKVIESRQKQFMGFKNSVEEHLKSQNSSKEYHDFTHDALRQFDLIPTADSKNSGGETLVKNWHVNGLALLIEEFGRTKSPKQEDEKINKERRMLFLITARNLFPDLNNIPKTTEECHQALKDIAKTLKVRTNFGIDLWDKVNDIFEKANNPKDQIKSIDEYIKYLGDNILKSGNFTESSKRLGVATENKTDVIDIARLAYRLEIIKSKLERELTEKGPTMSGIDTRKIKTIKDDIITINRIEQERTLVEKILRNSGSRIYMSFPGDLETREADQKESRGGGFQGLTSHFKEYRGNGQIIIPPLPDQKIIDDNDIVEVIDIRPVTRTFYDEREIVDKEGFWGIGRRTHKEVTSRREPISYGTVTGESDNSELAVALTYVTVVPSNSGKPEEEWNKYIWSDHTGRPGQKMIAEIILPKSMAEEVGKMINDDPIIIRQIVERIMKEQILKDPEVWQKGGANASLRPPWEKWSAEGGKIYIQSKMSGQGDFAKFDPKQLRVAR